MTRRAFSVGVAVSVALAVPAAGADSGALVAGPLTTVQTVTSPQGQSAAPVPPADVAAAIDKLGAFDLTVRTEAARTVRRAAVGVAVPALTRAAREHADGYVRYRALVLLAGFGDTSAADTMRLVMTDRNDRLRTVAYEWFEHHKDTSTLPALVEALSREQSEFVRPALLRALSAYGDDARARDVLLPLVTRGADGFRGPLIEALGDYHAAFAVTAVAEVAKLDGPLQSEAVTTLGKIGDPLSRPTVVELQRSAPREVQPAVASALCLLDVSPGTNADYLKKTLAFGATSEGFQPLLRSAAHGLAVLAIRSDASALTALLDTGTPARDPARAPIALALGLAALRNPTVVLDALEPRRDRDDAIKLLRDAFDMLASEDYELERFYVEVRRTYWASPANSPRRQLAEAIIQTLEF
jgi:HEAT repeat protein